MSEAIIVTSARTEELNAETRACIIHVCRTAHQKDDFIHLFSYIPSGGIHVLAYREQELVSHAVATTRWLQPEGLPLLRTAYVDAVATRPSYQGQGIGSTLMRHLATVIADFEMACLETERVSFSARLGCTFGNSMSGIRRIRRAACSLFEGRSAHRCIKFT